MKRLAIVFPLLLAACPAKQAGTGPTPQAGAGCPSAKNVYVASYVQQEPGKGRSGWVVALHASAVADASQVPEYATLDAAGASAAGVPAAPQGTLWLVTQGAPPCKGTLGSYYEARIDGPPPSATYGVELEGCPAPKNPDEAGGFVLVSDASPTGCRFEPPQPIAARLGQMDPQKQWQRPTKETPLPPAIAAIVPPHSCTPPACETLWAFAEVKVGGATVAWTGAVNWLQVGAPADQCSWPSERWSGVFVPNGSGATKVSEGQTHSLTLLATLVDGTGAKVLLAEGPGEFATYETSGALGNHVTWMVVPETAWQTVDDLGPICEEQKP
ncbi:MAG TPA: hypothetical protein VL326_09125 [Kofleriaceae bacterium]|nr:hypothetical protein [Kofleriaceae bacterium]